MFKTTYKCKFVTPAFIYGANPRKPEFRLPSLKGVIRYWWRAAKIMNPKELRVEEAKLFGSNDEKIGKSKLILKLIKNNTNNNNSFYLLPHKSVAQRRALLGSVKLQISSRKNIEIYEHTFELSLILGGLGKRSRRGYGSLQITKKNNRPYSFNDPEEFMNKLFNLLKPFNNYELYKYKIEYKGSKIDYPHILGIYLGNKYSKYEKALLDIGNATHDYNYDSLGFIQDRDENIPKRFASPIYVTLVKIGSAYRILMTKLNTICKTKKGNNCENVENTLEKQNEFIKELGGKL